MTSRSVLALVLLFLSATPSFSEARGPTLSMSLGGGGTVGGYDDGLFEGEIIGGYEVGQGFRPEIGLLLGLAPGSYVGFRPGLHFTLPAMPIYLRGAFDISGAHHHTTVRWLLLGVGMELRITGTFGLFAEGDTGIPLVGEEGVPLEVRAGVSFRF